MIIAGLVVLDFISYWKIKLHVFLVDFIGQRSKCVTRQTGADVVAHS